MASYEIHYFPGRGRAEPTRLALAAAGATFKNVTPKWPDAKNDYTFGQLPALAIIEDGKTTVVPQSMAMLRHVGRAYNLYGKDEDEHTQVDVCLEGLNDIANAFVKAFYLSGDNKEAELAKFNSEYLPKQVAIFEKLAAANGDNGHLVGSTLTIADIYLFNHLSNPAFTAPVPDNLKKVVSTVESDPKVAAYLKSDLRYPQ